MVWVPARVYLKYSTAFKVSDITRSRVAVLLLEHPYSNSKRLNYPSPPRILTH